MSIEKNQQALALAFKKCRGKLAKIKELGITPDMSDDDRDNLIEQLAVKKAEAKGITIEEAVEGQTWYVDGLIDFSALSSQDRLQREYEDSFADTATEAEMLRALDAMVA